MMVDNLADSQYGYNSGFTKDFDFAVRLPVAYLFRTIVVGYMNIG